MGESMNVDELERILAGYLAARDKPFNETTPEEIKAFNDFCDLDREYLLTKLIERDDLQIEVDELCKLRNEVEKLANYALTPTFVPEHAHKKLMEIVKLCHEHRVANTVFAEMPKQKS
jgi:hypothetical protein